MIDDPHAQLANLLAAELEAAQERWVKEVMKVEFEFADKGTFNGSARLHYTAERLAEGIVQYRQCILDRWITYIRPRLPDLSAHDRAALVEVALSALNEAITGALGQYQGRQMPALVRSDDYSTPITSAGARERKLLESELNLYMTTPTNTPASMNVNVTTHGPGSPVNVGSGTQTQQIKTADSMGELVSALITLLDAMKDQPHLAEVRDIVGEAKDEAVKPTPNMLKLRVILGGIKDAVQGVAALQPAWEAVHRVMQMLGMAI